MSDDELRAQLIEAVRRASAVPLVVQQALDDTTVLRPVERLAMWHLRVWLDVWHYREVYAEALAKAMGIEDQTAGRALRELTARGFLDAHAKRRPRAYRFPASRRVVDERAA